MRESRKAKPQAKAATGVPPPKDIYVVAVVDANPIALLVSALTLKSQSPDATVHVNIVASGIRVEVVAQVAGLLRARDICVDLREVPGFRTWAAREAALEAYCAAAPIAADVRRLIDVSGAGPEMALRSWQIAERLWGKDRFEAVSYESGRDTLRVWGAPGCGPGGLELPALDIGSLKAGKPRAVSVKEFLRLFGFRVHHDDPYDVPLSVQAVLAALRDAAVGILAASREEPEKYAECRCLLAKVLVGKKSVKIGAVDVPTAMASTLEHLAKVGLVARVPNSPTSRYTFDPPWDRGAGFFLRGGWLEILVAHALRDGLGDDHAVELNTGTAWGEGGRWASTYAEADAVFLLRNRLYVVSCKNEHDKERMWAHLDRFRALVAEYGEAWVRPVLLSTEPVEGRMLDRCGDYEIGCVSGDELLSCLAGDFAPGAHRLLLLKALRDNAEEPPAPGA
jgi:hypothetical protein